MAEELHVSPDSNTTPAWVVIGWAVIVSINLVVEVFDRWASFGLVQRCIAVVMLALIIAIPFAALSRNPRLRDRFSGRGGLTVGYAMLLLVTNLFGAHHF